MTSQYPADLAIAGTMSVGGYDGKIAGLYDLEETLGRGHYAVVKLARHVFTGEKVAVKVGTLGTLDEYGTVFVFIHLCICCVIMYIMHYRTHCLRRKLYPYLSLLSLQLSLVQVIDKMKLDEVSRAHLFQEVRCMKLVQHPHVVRLYEVIDTQTKLYLVLEWADGGDMYDYIMK